MAPRRAQSLIESASSPQPRLGAIDDDPLFCALLEDVVTASATRVGAAGSLADAAPLLAKAPHIVLLHLHLPNGHGVEAVARVNLCTGAIIVLTGNDGVAPEPLPAAGSRDVITKLDDCLVEFIASVVQRRLAYEGFAPFSPIGPGPVRPPRNGYA